jgi:hypothetical protein
MRFDWMATAQYLVQHEPLGERDFSLRGFEFDADPVIIDAMRRWAIKPVGDYSDFLRRAYWREAELSDGFVVDLGRDAQQPLTFQEVMAVDPYNLSVWYDAGDYSKHFNGKFGKGTAIVMGDECLKCHSFERSISGRCIVCERVRIAGERDAFLLAHPEIEAARIAKNETRVASSEAKRLEREAAERKAREASIARRAEQIAKRLAREATERKEKLARAAAKEAARIAAARERAAAQELANHEAVAVKRRARDAELAAKRFEGKPCRTCGGTTRLISDRACVACAKTHVQRLREKQRLAASTI